MSCQNAEASDPPLGGGYRGRMQLEFLPFRQVGSRSLELLHI